MKINDANLIKVKDNILDEFMKTSTTFIDNQQISNSKNYRNNESPILLQ